MTKYDYLDFRKTILSSDGKNPDIILVKGFNKERVLSELGKKGYLKGTAFQDYSKLASQGQKKLSFIILTFFFLLFPSPLFAFCFEQAGASYNISPRLLQGLTRVESSHRPYAINYRKDGKFISVYPDSYNSAIEWIKYLWIGGYNFDLGLGQINRKNIERHNINPYHLLDACYNLQWSAYFLSDCIDRYGYTWEAVGCYNASSKDKRIGYARKIYNELQQLSHK